MPKSNRDSEQGPKQGGVLFRGFTFPCSDGGVWLRWGRRRLHSSWQTLGWVENPGPTADGPACIAQDPGTFQSFKEKHWKLLRGQNTPGHLPGSQFRPTEACPAQCLQKAGEEDAIFGLQAQVRRSFGTTSPAYQSAGRAWQLLPLFPQGHLRDTQTRSIAFLHRGGWLVLETLRSRASEGIMKEQETLRSPA